MINETELQHLVLHTGHAEVNRPKLAGTGKATTVTGSIFRECLTTITRA